MKTFLEYVAEDIIAKHGTDLSNVAIVFPNKRASLFMNEYLTLAAPSPILCPRYFTIRELFASQSNLKIADELQIVSIIYHIYKNLTCSDEPLDKFFGWGKLMLSDFDDIDKNLGDADKIFRNMLDLKEMEDLSYLTAEQIEALNRFLGLFTCIDESKLKQNFVAFWKILAPIYHALNEQLESKGLTYEGALFKSVALSENIDFPFSKYIFIGFNVLQGAESRLFARLKAQDKALFYWDYDDYYIDEKNHQEAGTFIREHLSKFPNELPNDSAIYDNLSHPKQFTFLSAKTENLQARYVSDWLTAQKSANDDDSVTGDERIAAGRRSAIVLCDESLLQTVIHTLPQNLEKANITIGYPLSQTPAASFVNALVRLQIDGRTNSKKGFRFHYVRAVLRHPYTAYLSDKAQQLLKELIANHKNFPTSDDLAVDEQLSQLFTPFDPNAKDANLNITKWIANTLEYVGKNCIDNPDPLFHEAIFRAYTLMNRVCALLSDADIPFEISPMTFKRFMMQVLQTVSIPFNGDPAEGVQIMGILETRNLDFDHILLLSCNEGNMPKGTNDVSFIPYIIRKAYGLTVIDHKTSLFAYHFYRLIQRAKDVSITYCNATSNGMIQEKSRFILQLQAEREQNDKMQFYALTTSHQPVTAAPQNIEKTEATKQKLDSITSLSPSAINKYVRCPNQFFYQYVCGLRELDEDLEETDNRIFGDIFHRSAQLIYFKLIGDENIGTKTVDGKTFEYIKKPHLIKPSDIEYILKNKSIIIEKVRQAYNEQIYGKQNRVKADYNGLQLLLQDTVQRYIQRLLEYDQRLAPFTILGLECKVKKDVEIQTNSGKRNITIGGTIDRLDLVNDGVHGERIRVVDYKTGKPMKKFPNSVQDIFDEGSIEKIHVDYYLQTMLYSTIVRDSQEYNPRQLKVSPALIFVQQAMTGDYEPSIRFGNEPIYDIAEYEEEFKNELHNLVAEILNTTEPFIPTPVRAFCNNCLYAELCKK